MRQYSEIRARDRGSLRSSLLLRLGLLPRLALGIAVIAVIWLATFSVLRVV